MKSDLDILIDELQREEDYLKAALDHCIREWDFLQAENFKNAYALTRERLRVAKSLKNPNYGRIEELKFDVSNITRLLKEKPWNNKPMRESLRLDLEKDLRKRKESSEIELEKLNSILPEVRIDDDQLRAILEELMHNGEGVITFDFSEENAKLIIDRLPKSVTITIHQYADSTFLTYLSERNKAILTQLGFDNQSYKCTPPFLDNSHIEELIKILSILFFEVFNKLGDQEIELRLELPDPK